MRCLILFLMFGSAYAQPEWYGLGNAPKVVTDVEVCVRGDTADVMWIQRGNDAMDSTTAEHLSYDMNLTTIRERGEVHYFEDWCYYSMIDMTAISPEKWACLLLMNSRGGSWGYGQFFFNTKLIHGNSHEVNSVEVESSSYSSFPDHASGSWTQGHALRCSSDRVDVAYYIADIGPFDVWYTVGVHEYDFDLNQVNATVTVDHLGGPFVEATSRIISTSLPGDSVLVYSTWLPEAHVFLGPWSEIESPAHSFTAECGNRYLRESYLTESGRIVAVFDDETLRQIIPGEEGTAECVEFASMELDDANAWAFHPNYGFAALQVTPGYLLLARIDTSGNEVQPVGVLYETDGTNFIVDADVTISDSGEVIAVWSEYSDWNEGPHVLKIAWTDWTTYLDTPEQQAPTVPREISLFSYPNPFNSTVTIKYDLPQAGHAKLTAYDLQGRVVATLFDDFAPARSMELHWSPENLASGVYFITLEAPLAHATHKILLLK